MAQQDLQGMADSNNIPLTVSNTPVPTSPQTPAPSKAPAENTNFCGVTWVDHAANCDTSVPCPNGDECGQGETCFSGSPCAVLSDLENSGAESNVGNYCGTEWNALMTTVSSNMAFCVLS